MNISVSAWISRYPNRHRYLQNSIAIYEIHNGHTSRCQHGISISKKDIPGIFEWISQLLKFGFWITHSQTIRVLDILHLSFMISRQIKVRIISQHNSRYPSSWDIFSWHRLGTTIVIPRISYLASPESFLALLGCPRSLRWILVEWPVLAPSCITAICLPLLNSYSHLLTS